MKARELAALLDVSESMVSRLLSGDRRPSIEIMIKVKERFPFWDVDMQATAVTLGKYGHVLRTCMSGAVEAGLDDQSNHAVE